MKAGIHPEYYETDIVCACGAVYHTRSTRRDIKIGICAACHPFFTGEQKFVDTAGRVEKFARRYGSTKAARTGKKALSILSARCKSLCSRRARMKIAMPLSRFAPGLAAARQRFSPPIFTGCTIAMPNPPD